ncbi:MAG: CHAT domain-containing tetratricopeptide repeat protein [Bacteroidota bacterium]
MRLAKEEKRDSAVYFLKKASTLYQAQNKDYGRAKSLVELATVYYEQEAYRQSLAQFRLAVEVVSEKMSIDHAFIPLCNLYIAKNYFHLGLFDSTEAILPTVIDYWTSRKPSAVDLANAYLLLGETYLYGMGDPAQGETFFQQAAAVLDSIPSDQASLTLTRVQFALSGLYRSRGEMDKAIRSLQNILKIRTELLGAQHPLVANALVNIGNTYSAMGALQAAQDFYLQAIKMLKNVEEEREVMGVILHNLGFINDELGHYNQALTFYTQALSIRRKIFGNAHVETANTLMNLGLTYLHMGQYGRTEKYYNEVLHIHRKLYPAHHPELATTVIEVGYLYEVQGQWQAALGYYEEAASILGAGPEIARKGFSDTMDISDALGLLNAFEAQADMHMALHATSQPDSQHLQAAITVFSQIDHLIDFIRRTYKEEGSQLYLDGQTRYLYEKAIQAQLRQLREASPDSSQTIQQVFRLMEKSRVRAMQSTQQAAIARRLSQLADPVLLAEQEILDSLTWARQEQLRQQVQLHVQQESLEGLLATHPIGAHLHRLRKKHEEIMISLEEKYPKYHRLKYGFSPPALQDVQQRWLDEHTGVCQYFWGKNNLYTLIFTADRAEIVVRPIRPDLRASIDSLLTHLNPVNGISTRKGHRPSVFKFASEVNNFMFDRELQFFKKQPKIHRLILVPDGPLQMIPFESLISGPLTPTPRFAFQDYAISYTHSVSLQYHDAQFPVAGPRPKVLGIAYSSGTSPTVSDKQGLRGAEKEIDFLEQNFAGTYLKGSTESKPYFLSQAQHASIIHLALHGAKASESLQIPTLYFPAADSPAYETISYLDIMNLRLSTEFVNLGACESGSGKSLVGEGVMSMEYGFRYAGAKSIMTTLWPIDDHAAAELMEYFYLELGKGIPKDIALQRAKTAYLNQADPFKSHPAFWASHILIGDMARVELPPRSNWGKYIGGLFLFALSFFLLLFIYRRSKTPFTHAKS